MNREELIKLLVEIAKSDLADESELFNHPCIVAVRAKL